MVTIEHLVKDFTELYDGEPWFGDSYQTVIGGITAQEALVEPPNRHSIARLLWHIVKWRKALAERLLGDTDYQADVTDADNWRYEDDLTAQDWEEAKAQFQALQAVIVSELRLRNEAFLDSEFLPGKTYRHLAFGVIQQDIYHLGQIALLKSLGRF